MEQNILDVTLRESRDTDFANCNCCETLSFRGLREDLRVCNMGWQRLC